MNFLHSNNEQIIAYHNHFVAKKEAPYLIFHHGLMSNMNGDKALFVENYCKERGYNFIRYDNYGHGASSGKFIDQTISSWLEGLLLVIKQLTTGPVILVGSSLGAWISVLAGMIVPKRIIGIITISAAFDFTEELIWNGIDLEQKTKLQQNGSCEIGGANPECSRKYPISLNLIEDARQHLLLNRNNIDITCPVHLIHGMQDIDVPYTISTRGAGKIKSNNVVIKLIKDGTHSLSRPSDLQLLCNSIEEICQY
ncbi:MAG: alpha/beta hydrolase [Rickettsiaceae bacterium]|nr:alpha/beta hydrolase [Rickettsiaceae bacterium]